VVAMTHAVNREAMERLGAGSSAELLMPETLKGLKALLSISMYKKMWFPDRFYKDYLKVIHSRFLLCVCLFYLCNVTSNTVHAFGYSPNSVFIGVCFLLMSVLVFGGKQVMFTNRKERMELLQGLLTSTMDAKIPVFQQVP
jgi:hypothetical protein